MSNVLPNGYIPVIPQKVLISTLLRLPKSLLVELMYLWPKVKKTQPHSTKSSNQRDLNREVSEKAKAIRKDASKWQKRKIVQQILHYWPKGPNLLQLSQTDCQLIVDRPNSYTWIYSTAKDTTGNDVPISLNPQVFLNNLSKDLSALFMTHIYVCRHPTYPLIITRVQVFDLNPMAAKGQSSSRPHISSHRPYFVAIPLNSPHIIHTPGNDVVSNIVLQAVERSLPRTRHVVRLVTNEDQKPIRSLDSMHILKGVSRFGNSLGAWAPYADGLADMLPLKSIEHHPELQPKIEKQDPKDKIRTIANLRFKGSATGKVESESLFENTKSSKKRRAVDANYSDDELDDTNGPKTEFSSIAPIQYAEFVVKDTLDDTPYSFTLKLTGTDVFAGLHELAVLEDPIVDAATIPNWLTGEEGQSHGTVRNGHFTPLS